jgi:hypothetical protein
MTAQLGPRSENIAKITTEILIDFWIFAMLSVFFYTINLRIIMFRDKKKNYIGLGKYTETKKTKVFSPTFVLQRPLLTIGTIKKRTFQIHKLWYIY